MGIAGLVALLSSRSSSAAAFSDPYSYDAPIKDGGGGGRWFTGSPADGFGCDVCHGNVSGAYLDVEGLPSDAGYTPGQAYEVVLRWPAWADHIALVSEFVDESGRKAGDLALPLEETLTTEELCSEQDLQDIPGGDLLESQSGRQFVAVIDCGARAVRMRWTAPSPAPGTIWWSGGLVVSDHQADLAGDLFVDMQRALVSVDQHAYTEQLSRAGCSVATPPRNDHTLGAGLCCALAFCRLRRRAMRRTASNIAKEVAA
jgi:hypothetical protein